MTDEIVHVLLVEDNPGDARLVIEMMRENGDHEFTFTHVTTVREAIDHLSVESARTHAVLLDLSLPDESGLETVRRVVAAASRAVVVVMTGAGDEQVGLAAVQEGAQDYLVKGQVEARALRRAVRFALKRQGQVIELETQSATDPLTGLHNRRGFLISADQQMKLARRNRSPLLLLFIDLDGLKSINDTFGHAEGDRALGEVADVLRRCFRQSDTIARLGGDEFAALATVAPRMDGSILRKRLEENLAQINATPGRAYPLGFSVGVLECASTDTDSMDALLSRADALMYEEKRTKRKT